MVKDCQSSRICLLHIFDLSLRQFVTTELLIGPIFLFQVLPDIQTCKDSEWFIINCFRDM